MQDLALSVPPLAISLYKMTNYLKLILDTSSLISIGGKHLEVASNKADICISPISIYELLCHIDEHEAGEDTFSRRKGNLLKCKILRVLDDPFAAHAVLVGARESVNPTRFEDKIVLPQLIENLNRSQNLEEFYLTEVQYPNGEYAPVKDVAEKCRNVWEEEKDIYEKNIEYFHKKLMDGIRIEDLEKMQPHEFVKLAMGCAHKLAQDYKEDGIEDSNLVSKVFASIYLYSGYRLAKTKYYMMKAYKNRTKFQIDRNDTEDCYICLHLDLVENCIFVTDDKGTQNALKESLSCLEEISRQKSIPIPINIRIISSDEFRMLFRLTCNKFIDSIKHRLKSREKRGRESNI